LAVSLWMVYKTVRLAFAAGPPPRAKANKKPPKKLYGAPPGGLRRDILNENIQGGDS